MSKLEFNKEKCIQCGACIKDCITYSIEFGEDNFPQYSEGGESRCISCQHCFAVCPTGAITFDNKTPEEAENSSFANPEDILKTIKSTPQKYSPLLNMAQKSKRLLKKNLLILVIFII